MGYKDRTMGQSKKTIVLSCDPGRLGAIAVFQHGQLTQVDETPDIPIKLLRMLNRLKTHNKIQDTAVIVEQCPLIPFMNLKGIHYQLTEYGKILGIILAIGVTSIQVLPATWQADILPGRPKKKLGEKPHQFKKRAKQFSIDSMQRRYPDFVINTDGSADAIAIGLWGLKQL